MSHRSDLLVEEPPGDMPIQPRNIFHPLGWFNVSPEATIWNPLPHFLHVEKKQLIDYKLFVDTLVNSGSLPMIPGPLVASQ